MPAWCSFERTHNGVTDNLASLVWRRSRYCEASQCVEVASSTEHVWLRNSSDPDGRVLHFTRDEWRTFVTGVQDGDFDL